MEVCKAHKEVKKVNSSAQCISWLMQMSFRSSMCTPSGILTYYAVYVEVKNSRGDVLQCSHYVPIISPDGKPLPCVIYCHGNSGCRADASEAAIILLPSNLTVFTLDFSGSGLSGGDHVSLGWYEKDDLKAVVDYLRSDGNVSLIGLWGCSMGAITSWRTHPFGNFTS